MKVTLTTLVMVFATTTVAQYYNQSAPFNLVLVSDDEDINGDTLSACHAGAAVESLCLSNSVSDSKPNPIAPGVFYFNTSDQAVIPNTTNSPSGLVTWILRAPEFNFSEALWLYADSSTNVALPLFWPGDFTRMSFDKDNFLNIQGYVDDTVTPPVVGEYKAYYRWYACYTYYVGYDYINLAWVLGEGKPQNPSCIKVGVKRVFI